jgi:hypothetical protein
MKNSKQIELESKIIEAKYETLRIMTIEMFVKRYSNDV